MTTFSHQTFESLKSTVLDVSGLTVIVTADCKKLERLIFAKTKLQVSETTLKRVFGFVYCKFNPSMYTINSLAKYCDYLGWEDFCNKQDQLHTKEASCSADWDALRHNANKITSFTLQALKNKSGIPYPLTIKREFINQHLDDFLESGQTATVVLSPAGYGKTLALCHWVEEKMESNSDDIVLFFSSAALMNVFLTGRDMNSWMLALLGYSNEDDMQALLDVKQRQDYNFYLIVDGIDEHMYKNDQFQLVLSQLGDIFSFYQNQDWFKMVLSMRAATWVNNRHYIETGQCNVYEGCLIGQDKDTNVPFLNYAELSELCNKINPLVHHQVSINASETFRHPLYLQFYFKQNQVNFSLNNIDHTSLYDIISGFILDKVYMGHCSAEKMLLINALVEGMDLKARKFSVSKINVISLAKQHVQAYTELLSLGFIRELNTSNNFRYEANIEFVCNHFLNFSITQYLLLQNNRLFDEQVVNTIVNLFDDKALPILKWCVYYAVKNDQLSNLDYLADAKLRPCDKAELINFTAEMLRKEWSRLNKTATISPYFNQDCSDTLFNYLFGFENMSPDYVKTLQMLLKFRLSDHRKILIYSALAMRGIVTLELDKSAEYISTLRTFSDYAYDEFTVNPLHCLDAIYNYYKHGIIDKSLLTNLTKCLFNPIAFGFGKTSNAENDLMYILVAYVLKLSKNPAKSLRYMKMLTRDYKPVTAEVGFYNIMVRRLTLEDYMALGRIEDGIAIFKALDEIYQTRKEDFTLFLLSSYKCAKMIVSFFDIVNGSVDSAVNNVKMITSDYEYPNIKLYVLAFLFRYQRALDPSGEAFKQLSFDYAKIVRENGLHNAVQEHKQLG